MSRSRIMTLSRALAFAAAALLTAAPLAAQTAVEKKPAAKAPAKPAAKSAAADKPWQRIPTKPLPAFKPQMPKRIQLENGLVIFLQEDHELPLIEGFARIRGGSRDEPAAKVGMVGVYGSVWRTGGTRSRTGDELDDFLEARAAKVETPTTSDSTLVNWSALKGDFDEVLKVIVELMREPEFREEKLTLTRQQLTTAISRRNDDPGSIAGRESTKLAYGSENPYARTAEYWTLAAITRQDLLDWHKRTVHPNNMILGVVGDFDTAEMEQKLRRAFGEWPKGPEFKSAEIQFKDPKPGIYFVAKDDVNQSNIRMVSMGIQRNNPDYYAVEVMNEVLGGGFSGRLMTNIRTKKGLAYGVGGGIGSTYDHPGVFRLSMGTKSESTVEAINALYEEVDNLLANPATPAEMKRAKETILNSFIFNFDSKDEIMSERMAYEFYGYPADFLEQYQKGIEKVTAEDVARVARKYVHKDKLAVLVVGKAADFDKPLDTLGKVQPIDITIRETPAAGSGTQQAPAAAPKSNEQGKALIGKVVEAMGGKEKLQTVKAIRAENTVTTMTPQGEMEMKAVSTTVYPDRTHVQLTTPVGEMMMAVTPQAAFRSMAGQTQDLPGSAKDDALRGIRRDPIYVALNAENPSYSFAAGATENVGDAQATVLDIGVEGNEFRWWVNPNTGRILKASHKGMTPQGPGEIVTTYSDWKTFDGITVATKLVRTSNGAPAGQTVTHNFQVNPQVDASLFEKPAAK